MSRLFFKGQIPFHDSVVGVLLVCMVTLVKKQKTYVLEIHLLLFTFIVQSVDKHLCCQDNDVMAL